MNPMRSLKLWQISLAVLMGLMTQMLPLTLFTTNVGEQSVLAKSSGGRSGGGSFSRPSGGSSSGNSSGGSFSNPSYNRDSGGRTSNFGGDYYDNRSYNNRSYGGGYGGYSGGYGYGSPMGGFGLNFAWMTPLVIILLVGGMGWVAMAMMKANRTTTNPNSFPEMELTNDIVTVTKIQVALTAQARYMQAELNTLSQSVDTSTREGLSRLLQESCLALLRSPEYWTHVLSASETVRSPMEGQQLFNKLSIAERSKLDVESLVNVGGSKTTQAIKLNPEEDPAAYIIVTLLIGTAHDKPLFSEAFRNAQDLQQALEKLAALPPEYLMILEVIWSPQDEKDSLTEDELLTEYSGLVQL